MKTSERLWTRSPASWPSARADAVSPTSRSGQSPPPLTLPLPAKRAGRGGGDTCSNLRQRSWRNRADQSLLSANRRPGPLSPPLAGRGKVRGAGDWPQSRRQPRCDEMPPCSLLSEAGRAAGSLSKEHGGKSATAARSGQGSRQRPRSGSTLTASTAMAGGTIRQECMTPLTSPNSPTSALRRERTPPRCR